MKLSAGYSKKDITPSKPMQTIGFGRRDETSRGILQQLSAQITVWQAGGKNYCLAAIDHIGFSVAHSDELREKIGKIISAERENVMLCFSHTHSAPNDSIETEYFASVSDRILNGVKEAFADMTEVKAAWGNAEADIGINRRNDCLSLDKRIGVLKVTDSNTEKLKFILLRVTAHANVLKGDNYLISPDYFGAARYLAEQRFSCPVILTQGASGNVAPKYFKSAVNPPDACDGRFIRSETALNDMAEEIYRGVNKVINNIIPREINYFDTYSEKIELYADVPTYERAEKNSKRSKNLLWNRRHEMA